MDQVDLPHTGVITPPVLDAAQEAQALGLLVLADSRRGLDHFPHLVFKMNAAELARMTASDWSVEDSITNLANRNGRPVFVTLAERGMLGAEPGRPPEHVPAHPVRSPIDIVGAGDSVTANLAAALAASATPREAMQIAMAAASLVIHQLGTTGTATTAQIANLLPLREGEAPPEPSPGGRGSARAARLATGPIDGPTPSGPDRPSPRPLA